MYFTFALNRCALFFCFSGRRDQNKRVCSPSCSSGGAEGLVRCAGLQTEPAVSSRSPHRRFLCFSNHTFSQATELPRIVCFPAAAGRVPRMSPRLPWSVSMTSPSSLSLFLTSISFFKLFLQFHINTFSPLPLRPRLEVIMKPFLSPAVTLLLPFRCFFGLSLLKHLPNSLYLLLVCMFHFPTNQ